MVPARASPMTPGSIAREGTMSTRTFTGASVCCWPSCWPSCWLSCWPSCWLSCWPSCWLSCWLSWTTTLSVAVTPNPAPVTRVFPAVIGLLVQIEQCGHGGQVVGQIHVVTAGQAGARDRSGRRGERTDRVDDHGRLLALDLRPPCPRSRRRPQFGSGSRAGRWRFARRRRFAGGRRPAGGRRRGRPGPGQPPAQQLGRDRPAAAARAPQNPDFSPHDRSCRLIAWPSS